MKRFPSGVSRVDTSCKAEVTKGTVPDRVYSKNPCPLGVKESRGQSAQFPAGAIRYHLRNAIVSARVAKLVDAQDLKSCGEFSPCGFESRPGHGQVLLFVSNPWKFTNDAEGCRTYRCRLFWKS